MFSPSDINGIIDHATSLVMASGAVVGGIITVVKLLHNNRQMGDAASSSVPGHVVSKMIDQAAAGTTVNVETPAPAAPPGGTPD